MSETQGIPAAPLYPLDQGVYTNHQENTDAVLVAAGSNIDDILTANPSKTTFYFGRGKYYLTKMLNINRPNISFFNNDRLHSETNGLAAQKVHIFQLNVKQDGINVIARDFTMRDISVHDTYDGKVALTVAGVSNCRIEHCYFYGNRTTFSIYFAGPKGIVEGQATLDAFDNNQLDFNNTFSHNVIYSQWSGDAVSFSLQSGSTFSDNIVRGGKVAVYMCRDTMIERNHIYDSDQVGIFVSLPCVRVSLKQNKIYECKSAGIKVSNQMEHGTFLTHENYQLNINSNYIYDSETNAIELNNVSGAKIKRNRCIRTGRNSIYSLFGNKLDMFENKLVQFRVGIWLEDTSHCNIKENRFLSVYPDESHNVVKLSPTCNHNSIHGNIGKGKFMYDDYILPIETTGNELGINFYFEYYMREEELDIWK